MPAVFLFDWLALPLAKARGLLPTSLAVGVLAVLAEVGDLDVLANFAKLTGVTLFAFWFLGFFEELFLLVFVALIIPFVDAYSVFRGPTGNIVEHHSSIFNHLSFFFALPPSATTLDWASPTCSSSRCSSPPRSASGFGRV